MAPLQVENISEEPRAVAFGRIDLDRENRVRPRRPRSIIADGRFVATEERPKKLLMLSPTPSVVSVVAVPAVVTPLCSSRTSIFSRLV